tara:strand:- start:4004 stop:4300 length:297 start_codon:yes stop_codon:yes gene_type:complete
MDWIPNKSAFDVVLVHIPRRQAARLQAPVKTAAQTQDIFATWDPATSPASFATRGIAALAAVPIKRRVRLEHSQLREAASAAHALLDLTPTHTPGAPA